MTAPLKDMFSSLLVTKRCDLIFPTQNLTPRWNCFGRDFTKAMEGFNVNTPEKVTPHILRHSFASQLYKYARLDLYTIAKIMGHDNPATTELYVHLLGGNEETHRAMKGLPDYSDALGKL